MYELLSWNTNLILQRWHCYFYVSLNHSFDNYHSKAIGKICSHQFYIDWLLAEALNLEARKSRTILKGLPHRSQRIRVLERQIPAFNLLFSETSRWPWCCPDVGRTLVFTVVLSRHSKSSNHPCSKTFKNCMLKVYRKNKNYR